MRAKTCSASSAEKPFVLAPSMKILLFLLHDLGDFLAHRLAEDIRLAQAVAGELPHDEEHLLLVNDDAVGLFQDIFQGRVRIMDRFQAVLGFDEGGDVLHGARTVKGHHGRNIAEMWSA